MSDLPVDVDVLREEIRKTYTDVSTDQSQDGVDMTPAMLEQARASAREMGFEHVELHESLIESLPLDTASVDVVISNGVIDLVPDKDAVFDEIDRVLRPGGRLQIADVVIHTEVSEDARKRIDLWTG